MDGEGEEEDDISHHFYPRARLDSLLQVPDLASVGTIDTEDMAEMMKINREMLDIKELSQDDIDSLLNIDSFYPTNTNMSGVSALLLLWTMNIAIDIHLCDDLCDLLLTGFIV